VTSAGNAGTRAGNAGTRAVVVGSGPNGLAAAVALARAGVSVTVFEAESRIGGGARSSELTLPGLVHDDCSAFHPMVVVSPFMRSLHLDRYGLRWRWAPVELAHPLDGGRAAVLTRSVTETAERLGADGRAWRRIFQPLADRFDVLAGEILRPVVHAPRHPFTLARFGLRALQPATMVARRFTTPEARALFGGVAAHQLHPLEHPLTSSVGLALTTAAHAVGWPVAEGGTQAIANALVEVLRELGGTVETGVAVTSLKELTDADIVMLDVAPAAAADIIGDRLPDRVARAYRRFRRGPGAAKLDLAIEGGIPWTDERCGQAGTLHLGGDLEEIVEGERAIAAGRMPERPFVLVGQQYVADPTRSSGDLHPVWTYAHVPAGHDGDVSEAIIAQIERFAPGVRDRIRAHFVRSTSDLAGYNRNYVGGDIATGANDAKQLVLRPRPALDPYRTGVAGVYLCSAATPPGAGAHGMCGFHAARSALRALRS
jgi:phytoene dehydrogenase-like protein